MFNHAAAPQRIFISAGEPSGDLHASNLVRAILAQAPDADIAAIGGPAVEAAGARLLHDMLAKFAVMGFVDAARIFLDLKKMRDDLLRYLDDWRPDAAVLIDYPGFNIHLARHLKARGIKVYYYITPQVWAWASWRVHKIARRIDKALVVFPFEEEFFRKAGIDTTYVGHPLGDVFARARLDMDFIERGPLSDAEYIVALLPGSRRKEIEAGFAIKARAAMIISRVRPQSRFVVPVTTDAHAAIVRRIAAAEGLKCDVFVGKTYEVMAMSSFALATSGTATLELAHFGVPMVVLYRTNPAGMAAKSVLVRTPHVALVNIVAGREIVPEMVYTADRSREIAALALDIIADSQHYETVRNDVRKVGTLIEKPGASAAAARIILAP